MKKETKEWLLGIVLGLILTFLLAIKVIAAPISDDDAELIAKTVALEAGNQDMTGKRLVVAVILNRVEDSRFPDTVEDVLSAPGQFTTYPRLNNANPSLHDAVSVQLELSERTNDEVLYFRTSRYGTGEPMFQHGAHYFSK